MAMPQSMTKALQVHLHMMRWLDENEATYQQAMSELDRAFPGWFETDGDMWLIDWIEGHTL